MIRRTLFLLTALVLLPLIASGAPQRKKPSGKGSGTTSTDALFKAPSRYKPAPPEGLTAEAGEWSVDLAWRKSTDPYVTRYVIYAEADQEQAAEYSRVTREKVAETKGTSFREEGLEPDTSYTYWVTAVASNGIESEPAMVETATSSMTRPPLEMDVLEMKDIFSNNYKLYETDGIGRIRIRNNTDERIARLKVTLTARGYMDYPSELEVRNLEPHEQRTVQLKALLTNRVLDILEDTPLQIELNLSYYFNGQLRSYTATRTTMIHEKHRMIWKFRDMAAAFVTPKDGPVLDVSRSAAIQAGEGATTLMLAGAIYETLGALGITYVQDPANPYQITSGKMETIDYVQFPVETLKRKSGDCDDLVILYSALLESLGIRTLMADYPGHMFMLFSVGKKELLPAGDLTNMLFPWDGEMWVPVELTVVGSPFLTAWEKGARQYLEWNARKMIGLMDVRAAWRRYKPASLSSQSWSPPVVRRAELDARFRRELLLLKRLSLQISSPALFEAARADSGDYRALLQLGIRFGEDGDTEEAARYLNQAAKRAPKNGTVTNNIANLRMMEGNYEKARELYLQAAEYDPDDPQILINLARCHLRMNNHEAARKVYNKALEMQPSLSQHYRGLVMELGR